jgi:hypothetical protein
MATTSLTLVGNSADSRRLAQCRDTVYGTPPNGARDERNPARSKDFRSVELLGRLRRRNRDREGPHDPFPPTPPDIRITYPAVRQIQSTTRALIQAGNPKPVEVPAG